MVELAYIFILIVFIFSIRNNKQTKNKTHQGPVSSYGRARIASEKQTPRENTLEGLTFEELQLLCCDEVGLVGG